ncbi:MAG: peptide chain release factor N(5)-glutamine methyltransferase [Acidimicrobiales bacterium]
MAGCSDAAGGADWAGRAAAGGVDWAGGGGHTVSWGELERETAARLAGAGIPEPAIGGRLIAMRASGAENATEWVDAVGRPATVRGVAALDAMAARRLAGEPLQYVVADWAFRHLDLYVDGRVLIPRPETEVVAGVALAELDRLDPGRSGSLAADLGTGSGAIGLSLVREHDGVQVWMTDVSADALAVAQANLAGVGRSGSRVRIARGSWFEALPADLKGRFDVVVSNPPYVADHEELPSEVADWEPALALRAGPRGTEWLDHLVAGAPAWLRPNGALVLELAPPQADEIAARAATRVAQVEVVDDLTGRARAVVARTPAPSPPAPSPPAPAD